MITVGLVTLSGNTALAWSWAGPRDSSAALGGQGKRGRLLNSNRSFSVKVARREYLNTLWYTLENQAFVAILCRWYYS